LNEYSDNELIYKYKQSKDVLLVGELYKRYTRFVFLVAMKYLKNQEDSKEAVMMIFEKLVQDLLKHEIENFKSWLHVVTKNFCLQQLRQNQAFQKKHHEYENFSVSFMENETNLHHTNIQENEQKYQALEKAMNQLNSEQKICIELFYLQEKSYKEVVELTGFDLNKVKSSIQNGKRNLKLNMQKLGIILLFLSFFDQNSFILVSVS